MADGTRPFLKKGAGLARFRQRSVALNPPPSSLPAAEASSSENLQTPTQSLPLIENISPIPKEPALNIRPTTAETGDSGIRDINLQISPSNHTVTTYNRESHPYCDSQVSNATFRPTTAETGDSSVRDINPQISPSNSGKSPPKAPAETNVNESVGENLAQQYVQINPTSARLIEKHGPELTSPTNSYTSLDESPELSSNNSAEIYAPSRSKGSTSVGTSAAHDALNETENNDSVEVVHDSSGANKLSRLDSS
uniref:Uncharacterized protein n=1 Tax=Panagrolaimus davidi TaxID=227884 RepID=A0A914Q4W1_9BILA